jgi:hypothetical protein
MRSSTNLTSHQKLKEYVVGGARSKNRREEKFNQDLVGTPDGKWLL